MSYRIKEMQYTLQGEGAQSGRPAVLVRFAGCNLWSGSEQHRSDARCPFCDTDFVGTDGPGGGRYATAAEVATAAASYLPDDGRPASRPLVVCTGGEPLLQLDPPLVTALHDQGFELAVETNGTLRPPDNLDWICVSPKAGTELVVREGDELKLVFPQPDLPPDSLEGLGFRHFFLQPMDGPNRDAHTRQAVVYCLAHPRWRLSLQVHKLVGIP